MRIVRTTHGAQLVHGDDVLSEVLHRPGPTHSLWDLLAAACRVSLDDSPAARIAMLGFAGGGTVAPLRAMDCHAPIDAVDRSRQGTRLFRELSAGWCGDVNVEIADAEQWLGRRRRRYGLIVEDLSVAGEGGHVKPAVSIEVLPALIARRVTAVGVALFNLLPSKEHPLRASVPLVTGPFESALSIESDEYENRILAVSHGPLSAREFATGMRRALRSIESRQVEEMRVRTIKSRTRT